MTVNREWKLEAWRRMQRIRQFEEAAKACVKAGEVGGGHSSAGQEAATVGACMAVRKVDYMAGTHRSHGHPIGKGAALAPLMAELYGKVTGVCKGLGGSMHFADASVGSIGESSIVGGGIPIATGAAMTAQTLGTDHVSLCFFGDGAVNEGAFSESLNMAALWKLPVIYFCENNMYAISTSAEASHGQPDIAKRADGFGMPGVTVDGQDVEAVYAVAKKAVDRARRGDGPTLIEAKTYRFEDHALGFTMPIKYRSDEEVAYYQQERDPIKLYREKLLAEGIETSALTAIETAVREEVERAIEFARNSPDPTMEDVQQYMYSMPIKNSSAGRV